MARLSGARLVTLGAMTMVGRAPSCALNLPEKKVSSLHARFAWTGAAWVVRDLGSTNGTFVDGVRLPPGVDRRVGVASRIAFGDPEAIWVLKDDAGPGARAVDERTGVAIEAVDGVLNLGGEALIESAGRWVWLGERSRPVSDGERVEVGGAAYRLELPVAALLTPQSATNDDHGFALAFRVGDDEETLSLTVVGPEGAAVVPPRTSHYLLLTLARARLADRALSFPELQAGWREVAGLCRELATDDNKLNVEVHRLRKQLGTFGLPASVIERQAGAGTMRIGVARLVVTGH